MKFEKLRRYIFRLGTNFMYIYISGDNFNDFLNENAKEVDNIAGATNREVVNGIVFNIFKELFKVVPYDEIFV